MNITAEDFPKRTLASKVKWEGIKRGSWTHRLINRLNMGNSYSIDGLGGRMERGNICDCDDGYLCEHRLEYIINFIEKNYISKSTVTDIVKTKVNE